MQEYTRAIGICDYREANGRDRRLDRIRISKKGYARPLYQLFPFLQRDTVTLPHAVPKYIPVIIKMGTIRNKI